MIVLWSTVTETGAERPRASTPWSSPRSTEFSTTPVPPEIETRPRTVDRRTVYVPPASSTFGPALNRCPGRR